MAGEPEHTALKEKNGAYFIGKVHDAYIVHTAVFQKMPVGLKQYLTVKKLSP